MNNKEKLLSLLEENTGEYLSGEKIAKTLSISRAAIWKNIESLRKDGIEIDAVKNKGYSLSKEKDVVTVSGIKKYITTDFDLNICLEHTVSSTNTLVKEKADEGENEGYVLISLNQTKGKGRSGRSFFSPDGTGLYLSVLLRPEKWTGEQASSVTTMSAVAACEAIEFATEIDAGIKWVNDIYINNKKVSGILTEASIGLEDKYVEYIILGIGFNIYPPKGGFPKDIKDKAGSILPNEQAGIKNKLAGCFISNFINYYLQSLKEPEKGRKDYVKKYRERSILKNKKINVIFPNETKQAIALDIDNNCRLKVQYENGEKELLSSGEVSIVL